MSWREAVKRHFPGLSADLVARDSVTDVPESRNRYRSVTSVTLSRRGGSSQHDAHAVHWYEYEERAGIIEHCGEAHRRDAERSACRVVRLDRSRDNDP